MDSQKSSKLMRRLRHIISSYRYDIIIIIIISLIASIGIFKDFNQAVLADDVNFHFIRFKNFTNAISDGQFLPLIDPTANHGLSFSSNLFYGVLTPLIVNFLFLIFRDWSISANLFLYLCILGSGFTMYYTVKTITNKKRPSLIASILYMVAPYFMIDIYMRYAIGEIFAFTVAPILLLGLYQFINHQPHAIRNISISAICLILSHNLSAFLFAIMAFLLLLFNIKKIWQPHNLKKILAIASIIFGATAFYTIPLLEASSNVDYFMLSPATSETYAHMSSDALNNERISISHLFGPDLHADMTVEMCTIATILICLLLLPYFLIRKKIELQTFLDQLLTLIILCILGSSILLDWNLLPHLFRQIQFPWRLLEISTVLFPIICGVCYSELMDSKRYFKFFLFTFALCHLIGIVAFQLSTTLKDPNIHFDNSCLTDYIPAAAYYENGKLVTAPILNYYLDDCDVLNNLAEQYAGHITSIVPTSNYQQSGTTISFDITNEQGAPVTAIAPLFFYPGYQAQSASGHHLQTSLGEQGFVAIEIPANFSDTVTLSRTMTILQILGIIISGTTLFAFFILFCFSNLPQRL